MPVSFNKAQANVLASGFLDGLGGAKDEGLELPATVRKLVELGGFLISEADKNLNRKGNVATGSLSSSMNVLAPVQRGKGVAVDVEINDYYKFLNKGVKGVSGGSGEYSFKTANPSRKMVKAIEGWMKERGLRVANVKQSYKATEKKSKAVSEISSAYALAKAIKKRGIRKNGFWDKAISATQVQMAELGEAFKIDIVESIKKENGDSNK